MDVLEAIRSRRSHRSFKDQPVEPEKIDLILEAAHWAPSPANSQPWEFLLITGKDARKRVHELSEEAKRTGHIAIRGFSYVRLLPQEVRGQEEEEPSLINYSLKFMTKVPVIIGVVGLPAVTTRLASPQAAGDSYKFSCGAVIENIMLSAESLGLGSLWFTFFDPEQLGRFLQIDPSKHLVAMVMIGYPDKPPQSPGRVPLELKVRRID